MSTRTSKSEFEKLLSAPKEERWRGEVEFRQANKEWLSLSADIALKVMDEMDKQGVKGRELATRMGVSPQQVSKILKGHENLKLETIAKLNQALGVKIVTILAEDEIIVKNDMKSLIRLTKEILEQNIKLNLRDVSQRKQEVKVPKQPVIERNFSFKHENAPLKVNVKAGESNYAKAA
ncbi:helix-turn-helix domain-containing protein [Marinoscillum sp.]|uniref:helix-turn-helix domain-containing protein n=1 Tax=Marinoscillum sp. TaxID=2024838 RepID=UPI003BACAA87